MAELDYTKILTFLNSFVSNPELNICKEEFIPEEISVALDHIFHSSTQSFREVLLGSAAVRFFDKNVDLTLPYANQGKNAYNGRSLDEKVINPFLHSHEIPSSKGPFLATFRRSVKFDTKTASGLRDKQSFQDFLKVIEFLSTSNDNTIIECIVKQIIERFLKLRDSSKIAIAKIKNLSLESTSRLLDEFAKVNSGGLIPVILVVALLRTINRFHNEKFQIEYQGINEADAASNAAGDISVIDVTTKNVLLGVEVTERQIDENRVISTFNTKIVKNAVEDYLFIYTTSEPDINARRAAEKYYSQGYNLNFVNLSTWTKMHLSILGIAGRQYFLMTLIDILENDKQINSKIKVHWNQVIQKI